MFPLHRQYTAARSSFAPHSTGGFEHEVEAILGKDHESVLHRNGRVLVQQ